ncbi:site-specific DNA-methyltransferase [Selenomonas noxia]|uniref:site-specific DNA-methyltransferase n=1 Tax=Selenomonas noxia TaxID=135083 RepID=UPI0028EA84B3|nr:site-specific DNA-methyltransferase [Selenomonas noxia]
MERMKMHSRDNVARNVEEIGRLFPNALTEVMRDGKVVKAIDFDVLRQELSREIVEGREERYAFTWPDKRQAILAANAPIAMTLRPVVADSVGRDGTAGAFDSENLYIEGDNLDVLKLLQETYLGKVKMIYIDPPYNTGNDSFVYDDDFAMENGDFHAANGWRDEDGAMQYDLRANNVSNGRFHTDWLNMIYPRLRVAKSLLADDGFIAISIGEEEIDNLKKICDEVFGYQNYKNIIAVRRYDKNLNLQFAADGLRTMNVGLEYIYVYSRQPTSKMTAVYRDTVEERNSSGYWKGFWNNADRPTMRYELLGFTPVEGQWKWSKGVAEEAVENYIVYEKGFSNRMSLEEYWESTGKNKRFIRRNMNGKGKNMGVEHWIPPMMGTLRNSNWSDLLASQSIRMDIPFDSPKNIEVIQTLSRLFGITDKSIVLDFFSGSATTAHAVMQLNAEDGGSRKFIMVQLPEVTDEKSEAYRAGYANICEIGKERIRRAGAKIAAEAGEKAAGLDRGFRCLRLDTSNMTDVYYAPDAVTQDELFAQVDNVKADRTPEDLLFQTMLDLGILLSEPITVEEIAGKRVFNVADGFLLACFDCAVTDETVTAIAKRKPYYAVFRDASMADDSALTNFDQLFAAYSPATVRRVL